jgi:hypothetical protein
VSPEAAIAPNLLSQHRLGHAQIEKSVQHTHEHLFTVWPIGPLLASSRTSGQSSITITAIAREVNNDNELTTTNNVSKTSTTIEVKINYFRPVVSGLLACTTEIVNRGRTIANLESRVYSGETLVAQANGNYSIFMPRNPAG